jgi:hypothetical protein
MSPLRIIGSCLAAALCAFAISVGAALAQDDAGAHAAHGAHGAKGAPQGVCFLHHII